MFSHTEDLISESMLSCDKIKEVVHNHLECLENNFKRYFLPELSDGNKLDWIQNPYNIDIDKVYHLPLNAQEEFAELSSNSYLQSEFTKKSLSNFWLSVHKDYPTLSHMATLALLPFVSTYLCETAFSRMTQIKSKYRSCITNIEVTMRPAISKINPRFEILCHKKQMHISH